MNIERIKEELARTYVKIEKLQKKARDLEEQKKQAEDMEYLKIIRSNGVSAEELQLMIDISKEEQKKIMATKKKTDSVDQAEPTFSKEQLVKSATLGLPRDAVAAILKDGQQYTREQAIQLVTEFLERKV